ncbi:serpin family protein [Endozoicomonas sp. 2B-B]
MQPIRQSTEPMQWQTSKPPVNSLEVSEKASNIVTKLIRKLSLKILPKAVNDDKSKVVSATSLAPVLGMLLASMDDKERKALILDIPVDTLTDDLENAIHKKLGEASVKHAYSKDPDQKQAVSCAGFMATEDASRDEQLDQRLSECYQTEKLDCHDSSVARVAGSYINEKTNEKIKNLFDCYPETERDNIKAAIGSVIQFDCNWEKAFSPNDTVPGNFLCADGTHINDVKMMQMWENCHYSYNRTFGAIAKNFRSVNGENLRFVAISPREESATAINYLSSKIITDLISDTRHNKAIFNITLPKINVVESCDIQLLEIICETFGTDVIVAQDLAKLGKPENSNLSILLKTVLSINEEGAQKKLLSDEKISVRCLPKVGSFDFVCPGYIAIVDENENRLVELIIKDGRFFEFAPAETISSESLSTDDCKAESKRAKIETNTNGRKKLASKKRGKSGEATIDSIIEHLSEKTKIKSIDASPLIRHSFDPNGEFNIESAYSGRSDLSIKTRTKEDAIKIKDKISEWLDYKHECFVKVIEISDGSHVEVSFDAWDALFKKLKSTHS